MKFVLFVYANHVLKVKKNHKEYKEYQEYKKYVHVVGSTKETPAPQKPQSYLNRLRGTANILRDVFLESSSQIPWQAAGGAIKMSPLIKIINSETTKHKSA